MSIAQLSALEELVLIPITGACSADGYSYYELVVTDEIQGASAYATTGCEYLRIPGATAMLSESSFDAALFPADEGAPCEP
jgi:hypothetical protein